MADFERECIRIFVHAAQALSVPRSIGEIYGLLFVSREPRNLDQVVTELSISKGSASQGLRWLRDIGAIQAVYLEGDRRDYFIAETELRKLTFGYLREVVQPSLRRGSDYLVSLEGSAAELADGEAKRFADSRLKKLKRWHRFGSHVLPLLLKVAARF